MRCLCGPPRRPQFVDVSHRLRSVFDDLSGLLARVDVRAELQSETELKQACANHGTDFETGAEATQPQDAFVGTFVGIARLAARADLNGRVGQVKSWQLGAKRWRVDLLPDAQASQQIICVKHQPAHFVVEIHIQTCGT